MISKGTACFAFLETDLLKAAVLELVSMVSRFNFAMSNNANCSLTLLSFLFGRLQLAHFTSNVWNKPRQMLQHLSLSLPMD